MTFFETLIALMLMAVVLLQVARRTSIPYPTMLAAAGVIVALIPGTPSIELDGHTALALFLAPVLVDAAFDFPVATIRTLWRPLLALALGAVLVTTAVVAWIGWAFAGLPLAAAITLGAIVAPPDAAAATSILRSAALPRRSVELLTGESLLNDASALLLFGAAVTIQTQDGIGTGGALQLVLAVPGGILLGLAFAWLFQRVLPYTRGTLGGNLLEFVSAYVSWLVASRLGLSAVLCVVAMAMKLASLPLIQQGARNRVQSFAVWSVAVFLLNVLAFLLMGMQVRDIINDMEASHFADAAGFAAIVVFAVIATRMIWVIGYNRLAAHFVVLRGPARPTPLRQGILIGWCGMRGLVTLAAAFSLPADFPQRDLIVLSSFAVVLATLVFQGLTLAPLAWMLGLRHSRDVHREVNSARLVLADVGLDALSTAKGKVATETRRQFQIDRDALDENVHSPEFAERRKLRLTAIAAQRARLHTMRDDGSIAEDVFEALQEELDWRELSALPEDRRMIEEG